MLLAVELENQRLEDELRVLKVRQARRADASRWLGDGEPPDRLPTALHFGLAAR